MNLDREIRHIKGQEKPYGYTVEKFATVECGRRVEGVIHQQPQNKHLDERVDGWRE